MTYNYTKPIPATLADALDALPEDTPVAIGASSSFLFIGELSRYIENESAIERYCVSKAAAVYKNAVENAIQNKKPLPPPPPPFVPFGKRAVREMYYRQTDDEPLTLVILIEGDEIGFQWFAHELEEAEEKYLGKRGKKKRDS